MLCLCEENDDGGEGCSGLLSGEDEYYVLEHKTWIHILH